MSCNGMLPAKYGASASVRPLSSSAMTNRDLVIVLAAIVAGCGGSGSETGGSSSAGTIPGSDPTSSNPSDPGTGNGGSGGPGSSSGGPATVPTDLCAGLVTDKAAHPMTALAKPAVG